MTWRRAWPLGPGVRPRRRRALPVRPLRLRVRPLLYIAFIASLLAPPAGSAQDLVPVPDLRARVTDLTGTLDPSQAGALEAKLAALEDETGTQIAVLIVPTVRPEAIEQYALRVVEAWRLGREDVDDGALLLVALEDREVRIEVGYGLEGALTDATSNRIIDEAILPHFRTGDMYGGLAAGVDRMIAVARGEELPPPEQPDPGRGPGSLLPFAFVAFVLAMVVGGVLRAVLGRVLGATATGGLAGLIVFVMSSLLGVAALAGLLAFILALVTGGGRGWSSRGRRRGPGFGGFGGGFGGFSGGGGFGGGGFGGFSGGGGSFGGGGASGGW